jgi:hypothetical protein
MLMYFDKYLSSKVHITPKMPMPRIVEIKKDVVVNQILTRSIVIMVSVIQINMLNNTYMLVAKNLLCFLVVL